MAVHNHRPWRPMCPETRLPDGSLQGACMRDETPPTPELHTCGWPVDSFACRIRHQHLNTGAAKAAND